MVSRSLELMIKEIRNGSYFIFNERNPNKIEYYVIDSLKKYGKVVYTKFNNGDLEIGEPDAVLCIGDKYYFVEIKTSSKRNIPITREYLVDQLKKDLMAKDLFLQGIDSGNYYIKANLPFEIVSNIEGGIGILLSYSKLDKNFVYKLEEIILVSNSDFIVYKL